MQLALPIFQGGMGVGVSLAPLASAVAAAGGLGLVSSAGLDRIVSRRIGRKVGIYEAVRLEVEAAKARGGFAGVNIMVALQRDFVASVRAALDAGADAIVSGAGLPLSLPTIQPARTTALIPIVSSARALAVICRRWERQHVRPDAVVLEGPLAGGPPRLPRRPGRPRGEHARAASAACQGGGGGPRRPAGDRGRRRLHARGHPPLHRARRRRRADGHALPRHRGEQRIPRLQGGGRARAA